MSQIGIRRLRLLDGAAAANGHVVIVDVLRAATACAYALAGGAERVVMVADIAGALELRRRQPGAILFGEVAGEAVPEFDFDNSPTLLERADLAGRTLVQRTSSGVQGLLAARHAQALFFAGFVTAGATARVISARKPQVVSLVAMGTAGGTAPTSDDEACAAYIESLLRGRPLPTDLLIADVRRRIGDEHPAPTWRDDVERALAIDRFDFAIEVVREDGLALARAAR